MRRLFHIILLLLVLFSCGTVRRTASKANHQEAIYILSSGQEIRLVKEE